ncbi:MULTISPECIES: hypothetical protein [unclassified Methanosarcina]|uniref:hypothetical protein n=1 Tax=unclassified Methanosarcina TaxID=2644672 RepID=UPI000AECB94F|nr:MULTISPECIES: hypothetical protein [unclassified Methanosarcina]
MEIKIKILVYDGEKSLKNILDNKIDIGWSLPQAGEKKVTPPDQSLLRKNFGFSGKFLPVGAY